MFNSKIKKEIEELKKRTAEDIQIEKDYFNLLTNPFLRKKTIKETIDDLYQKIEKIENGINDIYKRGKNIQKDIEKEFFTIDTFKGYLLSFEDPNNALEKCEELFKKNTPFKMNEKLKKIYLETTEAEKE